MGGTRTTHTVDGTIGRIVDSTVSGTVVVCSRGRGAVRRARRTGRVCPRRTRARGGWQRLAALRRHLQVGVRRRHTKGPPGPSSRGLGGRRVIVLPLHFNGVPRVVPSHDPSVAVDGFPRLAAVGILASARVVVPDGRQGQGTERGREKKTSSGTQQSSGIQPPVPW